MANLVAGIDVGDLNKGFHLVILREREIVCAPRSKDAADLLSVCIEHDVRLVGIDAPCQWSVGTAGRKAEKEMMKEQIFCFSTPTEEKAQLGRDGFYGWMLNGRRVFDLFAPHYPLMVEAYTDKPGVFETFPHAITCALLGTDTASAKKKRAQRRDILERSGIDTSSLRTIDDLDAALCALTAQLHLEGRSRAYGDAEGGYIVVPNFRLPDTGASNRPLVR
ncbi:MULTISPECIES: DUF429 domain-containing protein [unclassified Cupriavidus]|uniref:DUF429 domain-containing protein n=1 Tax=unclassified Cupriavidus TaxID=2640874 RepID=UPI00313BD7AD